MQKEDGALHYILEGHDSRGEGEVAGLCRDDHQSFEIAQNLVGPMQEESSH